MKVVRLLVAAGAVLKAVDSLIADAPLVTPLWLVAAWLAFRQHRAGYALIFTLTFVGAALEVAWVSHHTMLIGWVAGAFALFDGGDLRLVLRVQAAVVYLFAGLNKANEHFLSGGVFEARDPWLFPEALYRPAAIAAVACELWLAVAVWLRWRSALPVAVLLHVGIVAGWMVLVPQRMAQLVLFNLLAVCLVAVTVRSRRDDDLKMELAVL